MLLFNRIHSKSKIPCYTGTNYRLGGGGQAGGGHRKRLRASLERNTSTVNLKIIRDVMYRYLLSAVSFIISNDQL